MVTHIIRKGHEKTRTMDRRCSFLLQPCQKAPASFWVLMTLLLALLPTATGLRCYVCGGSTGRECEEIVTRRWSPYVRPRPVLTSDGKRQWEECNDLINNKGCIKQVVDGGTTICFLWQSNGGDRWICQDQLSLTISYALKVSFFPCQACSLVYAISIMFQWKESSLRSRHKPKPWVFPAPSQINGHFFAR